jgi:hypothetical protein
MPFAINHNDITYATTPRGINATAPIRLDGNEVGRIEDIAERICTPVTFADPKHRAAFLEAAKQWAPKMQTDSDDMRISEFARQLLELAEGDMTLDNLGAKA